MANQRPLELPLVGDIPSLIVVEEMPTTPTRSDHAIRTNVCIRVGIGTYGTPQKWSN